MLTLLILALIVAICLLGYVKNNNHALENIGMVALVFFTSCFIDFSITHFPPLAYQKQLKIETWYQSITQAIAEDSQNTVVLAGEIAEYNSEVLKGRYAMHSAWLSFQEYSFWDDIPLIGLEGEFE